jgi:hypothetical protein
VVEGGEGSPASHIGSRPTFTAMAVEKTCRAMVMSRFEGPEVLEIRQGMPVPNLKPQEVLVCVRCLHQPLGLAGELPILDT